MSLEGSTFAIMYVPRLGENFASTFRAPVRLMPHLWSPMVLEKAMARAGDDKRFDYEPGRKHWRVAIFEPNICMVKTSFIPMLGCEAAHRAQGTAVARADGVLRHRHHAEPADLRRRGGARRLRPAQDLSLSAE